MKIVPNILNFCEKNPVQTMILKTSIISPCLQYQAIREQKTYEPYEIV